MIMKQVPDRKRLRREYVQRKRDLWLELALGSVVLSVLLGILAVCFAAFYIPFTRGRIPLSNLMGGVVMALLLFFPLGAIVRWCLRAMQNAAREVVSMVHVPRAIRPDTLPADEILVRGSEEPPVAQSEVLLRAAHTVEISKEELLRVPDTADNRGIT
jgi:hypothetical protein